MMKLIVKCITVLLLLAVLSSKQNEAYAQHSHDDEAFHLLVEAITGIHKDVLTHADIDELFQTLGMRFHLHEPDCFEKIHSLLGDEEELNATGFFETAQRTLQFLIDYNCTVALETEDLVFDESSVCQKDVNHAIREMEKYYEVYSSSVCFNEFVISSENCSNENEDVVYTLLTHLYEGNCILPSSEDLVDNLFELIGADDKVVTEENFSQLLSSLQIAPTSDEDHDHDHDDEHDHDHDHEHDHDHDHDHDDNHNHYEEHVYENAYDYDYNHQRKRRDGHDHEHTSVTECFSDFQLRSIFGFYGNISEDQLMAMCPVFLQQIVGGMCLSSESEHDHSDEDPNYTVAMKYGYGTAAVIIISLLALLGLVFFPVIGTTKFALTMQFFIALGVGTMSGDALFHIIPEMLGVHDHSGHDHSHEETEHSIDYLWKLVVAVGAIWALFLFENGLKVFSSSNDDISHQNHTDSCEMYENKSYISSQVSESSGSIDDEKPKHFKNKTENVSQNDAEQRVDINAQKKPKKKSYLWGATSTGIVVFIGDVIHNFGDGIAIGTAFSVSWPQGVGTSLAIIFHEIPHEFGDFAIYLNNGLSKTKALLANFIAACCCFAGLYIGIALSEDPGVRTWLLSFVAGMFLYVSLVNVLHELVEEKTSRPKLQFVLQNLGLLLGWTLLLLISIYEEDLIFGIA